MQKYEEMFTIFLAPFDVTVESMLQNIQMELIDLKSSMELKSVIKAHKHEFYRYYIVEGKFPKLKTRSMHYSSIWDHISLMHFFHAKNSEIEEKQADR